MNTVGVAELALRSGVKVPEVVAGSVAERAGLRVGDVILAVDGQEIPPIMSSIPAVVREIKCVFLSLSYAMFSAPAVSPQVWTFS